jgi:hypothetical protein
MIKYHVGGEKMDNNEAEIEENINDIKQRILIESKALDEISNEFNSSHEIVKGIEAIKTIGSFERIITWFLAITIGTLLWMLSNFDKFNLPDTSPPLMPHKDMYMLSIFLIALSSILLIIIQSILYINHHRNEKNFTNYEINYRLSAIKFERYKRNWNKMVEEYAVPCKEISKSMEDLMKERLQLLEKNLKIIGDLENERKLIMEKYLNDLDQSADMFVRSAGKVKSICESEYVLLIPAISYVLGFALIAAYILIFMNFYIK